MTRTHRLASVVAVLCLVTLFAVRCSSGDSGPSSPTPPAGPNVTPPSGPPSNLVVSQTSSTSVGLSWTDNSGGADSTVVLRSTDNATFTAIATVPAGTTTYSDTGLTADTTYYYEVSASNGGGTSSPTGAQPVAVLGGLIFNFDAAQANGHSAYAAGCAADQLTWYDISPSVRNGTLTGFQLANCGASSGWNGTGTTGDPYRLDLTNTHFSAGVTPPNYVYIDDSGAQLNPSHITIAAWLKPSAFTSGSAVVCKGTGGGGEVWCLDIYNAGSGNKYRFFIRNPGLAEADTSIAPDTTKPQHIVATYDGSQLLVYLNGALNTTHAASGTLTSNTHQLSIGARQGGTTDYDLNMAGSFYQVQVFSNALTQPKISQLCQAVSGRFSGVTCN